MRMSLGLILFNTLNATPLSSSHNKQRLPGVKRKRGIAKGVKKTARHQQFNERSSNFYSESMNMYRKRLLWIYFAIIVGIIAIGCYATSKQDGIRLRDFSFLKNVLEASKVSTCDDVPDDKNRQSSVRRKRSIEDLDEPECLEKTDPIFYVSRFHRGVCHASVELAYEVFFERQPTEKEFRMWYDKCVMREIDEAYLMWKFAESDEHMEMLERKRNEKNRESDDVLEVDAEVEAEIPVKVPLKLRIEDEEYLNALNDTESEEFKELADAYAEALIELLKEMPGLLGVKILGFGKGSLVVFYELIFDDEVKTIPKLYDDEADHEVDYDVNDEIKPFDSEKFAQKIREKVKDVIKEAMKNQHDSDGKLKNTVLENAHVDLESVETIPEDVVDDLVEMNPDAPIVKVDLTSHPSDEESNDFDYEEGLSENSDDDNDIHLVDNEESKDDTSKSEENQDENTIDDASKDDKEADVDSDTKEGEQEDQNTVTESPSIPLEEEDLIPVTEANNAVTTPSIPETTTQVEVSTTSTATNDHIDVTTTLASTTITTTMQETTPVATTESSLTTTPFQTVQSTTGMTNEIIQPTESTDISSETSTSTPTLETHNEDMDNEGSAPVEDPDFDASPDDVVSYDPLTPEESTTVNPMNHTDGSHDESVDDYEDVVDENETPATGGAVNSSTDPTTISPARVTTAKPIAATTPFPEIVPNDPESTNESNTSTKENVTKPVEDSNSAVTQTPNLQNSTESAKNKTNANNTTPSQTVMMKLRVTNMNYTQNLTDRQSEEFQLLEAKFIQLLRPLLQSMDGFVGMEVLGFSYGSLIVNNELQFQERPPVNVKEDVKDRIRAASSYFRYAHLLVDPDATEVLKADEADLCEFVQCHLYSDCIVRPNYRTECVCRPGYVSIDPSMCVSICDLEPGYCRNGGECQVVPGRGPVCRCKVSFNWGFTGERCEEPLPRSVVLVSLSTAIACIAFFMLLVGFCYSLHRRKKIAKNRKREKIADRDFMRAAQAMTSSLGKRSKAESLQRVNPVFETEDEINSESSGADIKKKDISNSPQSSNNSIGSMSTQSFYVQKHISKNGPLPHGMNTPERRLLNLQIRKYPDHKGTWGRRNQNEKRGVQHPRQHRRENAEPRVPSEHGFGDVQL